MNTIILKPLRLEHQIMDAINHHESIELPKRIKFCKVHEKNIVSVNGYQALNPIVKDDDVFFTARYKGKLERCYYPLQYACIVIVHN